MSCLPYDNTISLHIDQESTCSNKPCNWSYVRTTEIIAARGATTWGTRNGSLCVLCEKGKLVLQSLMPKIRVATGKGKSTYFKERRAIIIG